MRGNPVVNQYPNPAFTPNRQSPPPEGAAVVATILSSRLDELGPVRSLILSVGLHVGVVVLAWLILIVLHFLGINLITFDPPQRAKDIEFQLVEAPQAKPRNPNTRIRAERSTRSGGQRTPNQRIAQPMKMAGSPQSKQKNPSPSPQASVRPKLLTPLPPRPQRPKAQTSASSQTAPKQSSGPSAPPRPRVTAPKPSNSQRVAVVPNPLAPVKVPDAPAPAAATGPVVRGPVGGSGSASATGSSGSSVAGPVTAPGQFAPTGGGSPSGGGHGESGRNRYSQAGSAGGGGGAPGVDALAEPDFGAYMSELQRRIRRNWTPPEAQEDKRIVMMFSIARDGRLLNIRMARGSGSAAADSAARSAIERSAPFRPLPPEFRGNSINIEFTFDYNVFRNRASGVMR